MFKFQFNQKKSGDIEMQNIFEFIIHGLVQYVCGST